jgi:thioredoxin-dependent peroxiredoxin
MLKPGQLVPDFVLPNQDGTLIRLSDFRGSPVVVFTFPNAGTAGCTVQACTVRDAAEDAAFEGAVVLGLSANTLDELRAWKQERLLPYDLLSDPEHGIVEMFEGWRLKVAGLPLLRNRTLWIVDEEGRVFEKYVPVSPMASGRLARAALGRLKARSAA